MLQLSKFRVCGYWVYGYFCSHTNSHHLQHIEQQMANIHWQQVEENMNNRGFALVPGFLHAANCTLLVNNYNSPLLNRKKIAMECYRFGSGEYKYFSYPLVLFINEPGKDYTGGEFALLEQIPGAQSRAIVLQPKLGDMLIFTTQFRPVRGKKGCYLVNIKHGVSELYGGERHTRASFFTMHCHNKIAIFTVFSSENSIFNK